MFNKLVGWFEKHSKISWMITVFGAWLIYYISSITFNAGSSGGFHWKPFAYHFLAFFFFGAFMLISFVQGKHSKLFFGAILCSILYGALDEVHQLYVPGRSFSFLDIFIDSLGVIFAGLLYFLLLKRRRKI